MGKKRLPQTVYVYQSDTVDGIPVFAVTTALDEIPEDAEGQKIGVYELMMVSTFMIKRSLRADATRQVQRDAAAEGGRQSIRPYR